MSDSNKTQKIKNSIFEKLKTINVSANVLVLAIAGLTAFVFNSYFKSRRTVKSSHNNCVEIVFKQLKHSSDSEKFLYAQELCGVLRTNYSEKCNNCGSNKSGHHGYRKSAKMPISEISKLLSSI